MKKTDCFPDCSDVRPMLDELLRDELEGRERVLAKQHVEHCDRCADELDQIARGRSVLEVIQGEELLAGEQLGLSVVRAPTATQDTRSEMY